MKWRVRRTNVGMLVLAAIILVTACATQKGKVGNSTGAVLQGMVYNKSRNPVLDMSIRLVREGEAETTALTDIHGRFAFPDVPYGKVMLELRKDGYEPLTWTFAFDKPTQVVYVQMTNQDELLDDTADAIQKRDWIAAASALDRVDKIGSGSRVAVFLRAEILAGQGKPKEAASMLEGLSAGGDSSLAVELSLADLYQTQLDQCDKALAHLRKALAIQDDADIENRITELEKR